MQKLYLPEVGRSTSPISVYNANVYVKKRKALRLKNTNIEYFWIILKQ